MLLVPEHILWSIPRVLVRMALFRLNWCKWNVWSSSQSLILDQMNYILSSEFWGNLRLKWGRRWFPLSPVTKVSQCPSAKIHQWYLHPEGFHNTSALITNWNNLSWYRLRGLLSESKYLQFFTYCLFGFHQWRGNDFLIRHWRTLVTNEFFQISSQNLCSYNIHSLHLVMLYGSKN